MIQQPVRLNLKSSAHSPALGDTIQRPMRGIDHIGHELQVDCILEGGMCRASNRVGVTAIASPTNLTSSEHRRGRADADCVPATQETLNNLAFCCRTAVREPHDVQVVSLNVLSEGVALDFHADAYNVLNHPNYANPGVVRLAQSIPAGGGTATAPYTGAPSNTIQPGTPFALSSSGNSSFGTLTNTVGNQVGIGANRQLQLSLRILY